MFRPFIVPLIFSKLSFFSKFQFWPNFTFLEIVIFLKFCVLTYMSTPDFCCIAILENIIPQYSAVKQHMESQLTYKYAADSGYSISQVMVKPYDTVAAYNDRRKSRFNTALSGIRTIMTENIFGRWKKRFPK